MSASPVRNQVTASKVFNAVGETVDVVTVRESQIEPLTADELFTVRSLATTPR